ncbi:MAG: hypothetical protein BA864_00905 [Desulfuromonadales bacterium C00003093]|nr:MAG: hypothetical protein BA864_00905 [Desulfuromonadales bacterium C00003093]
MKSALTRRIYFLLFGLSGILAITLLAFYIFSSPEKLTKVTLRLNWKINGDHAPFYVALDKGLFNEVGLDVEILEGSGSASTVKLIGTGSNYLGYADAGTMIKGIASGLPVKAVCTLVQMSPMAVIFLPTNPIRTPQDLKGKTIGLTSGDSLSQIFPAVLAANSISPRDVRIISFSTPWAKEKALLQGQIDAFLGYYLAQPVRLKITRDIDLEWLSFAEAGVNTLSNSIIVNTRFLREQPDLVRKFLLATQKGAKATLDNPRQAAQILSKYSTGAGLNFAACKMQIEVALKLLHTDETVNKPIGWTSSKNWEKTLELLKNYAGLRRSEEPSKYYTNDYLSNIR